MLTRSRYSGVEKARGSVPAQRRARSRGNPARRALAQLRRSYGCREGSRAEAGPPARRPDRLRLIESIPITTLGETG